MNQHLPCPCGKSSDAFAIYENNGYCFSGNCERPYFSPEELENYNFKKKERRVQTDTKMPRGVLKPIKDRGLTEDTLAKYDVTVRCTPSGDITDHCYPYFNQEGQQIAAKYRRVRNKSFQCKGRMNDPEDPTLLFGQQFFQDKGPSVTITEGELDACAAYQLMGSRYPAVSIKNGVSSALKECKQEYEWLNSFKKIVVCFDNDKAGQSAAKKVAALFPGKVYILKLQKGKDPCDYSKENLSKEFVSEWWGAKRFTLEGFITGEDIFNTAKHKAAKGIPLCWPLLTEITYGVRPHEIWTFGGGTGVGKTELFKELAYHLAVHQKEKVGLLFLEENITRTAQCMIGKDLNKRIYLEEYLDDLDDLITQAPHAKKLSENIVIVKHEGNSDFNTIIKKIEYMVNALGCKYIFYDHFTASAEGKEDSSNNKAQAMMEELNKLVQSLSFSLFMVSHLRKSSDNNSAEEGGRVKLDDLYGSSAIKQRSNFVFGIEGNLQAEGLEKDMRILRCLKDRNTGSAVGKLVNLNYDQDTGRLNEYDIDIFEGEDYASN